MRPIRGSNQYRTIVRPVYEDWKNTRHFGIRAKTWLSVLWILLLISPTVVKGYQDAYSVRHASYVSPLPLDSYAHLNVTYTVAHLPTTSETAAIFERSHGDILFRIWTLESSRGQNGRLECEAQGQINTMGYDVADHKCFASFDSQLDTVNAWFDRELKTHPLANSLCLYNEGVDRADCPYAKHFLNI